MVEPIQIESRHSAVNATRAIVQEHPPWLSGFRESRWRGCWSSVESRCTQLLWRAARQCSPSGADSLIEVFSATVVLWQFLPRFPISQERAHRIAGLLLFALALVVAAIAGLALTFHAHPEKTRLGLGITIAALIAMPVLARLKNREAIRSNNPALRADAVQSATCAYLAAIRLRGRGKCGLNIAWFDSLARLSLYRCCSKKEKLPGRHRCGCC